MSSTPPPADRTPRPLTGGAMMAGAGRITVAVTGALTTVLIARLLGPDGSGGYVLAQSIVLLLTVATTMGVEHGIAYYVSGGEWAPGNAYASALRVSVVMGLAGAAAGLLLRLAIPSAFGGLSVGLTAVVVAALPFALLTFYVPYIALAIDRYEAYVLPTAFQSALALVLAGTGAIAFDLEGAVGGLAASYVITGLAVAVWGARRLAPRREHAEERQLRRAVSFGIKGYAANALQMINYRFDLFVLSAVATTAAVGHYSVALAVTSVLVLAPAAVSEVLFPRIAHLSARPGEDAEAHRDMVEVKGLRHVTLAVLVMTAVLALALLLLVVPVYGHDFRPAIALGLILLPGVAANGISGVLAATVVGRGRPKYSLYAVLISTPPTLVLYAVLIPWLDATGAALASTLSYLITFVAIAVLYGRLTGRSLARSLVPTRSEWHDLRALPDAVIRWARQAHA
jgi:O-antigen/teichoic acid export membrane protein